MNGSLARQENKRQKDIRDMAQYLTPNQKAEVKVGLGKGWRLSGVWIEVEGKLIVKLC